MLYSDIDPKKKAFIFEFDNVLYPQKDFWLQVYYLFASFLEYTEQVDAKAAVDLMAGIYKQQGNDAVFAALQKEFNLDDKYRQNLRHLTVNAQLPLKLILYPQMLSLLQEIVVDRKQLFLVTNGNPKQQLNKIKQTEWHGLDKYMVCYFAEEFTAKPEPDIIYKLLKDHNLERRDILITGNTETDELTAQAGGIDYLDVINFLY